VFKVNMLDDAEPTHMIGIGYGDRTSARRAQDWRCEMNCEVLKLINRDQMLHLDHVKRAEWPGLISRVIKVEDNGRYWHSSQSASRIHLISI